jgi:hypothetical protein
VVRCQSGLAMTARFPPPWSIEERPSCFVVSDDNGQQLACIYFEVESEGRPLCQAAQPRRGPMDRREHH